jgi:hypothetical protein
MLGVKGMQRQVIITLPEELYENARRWALMTHREVPETLTDILANALLPVQLVPNFEKPVSALPDKDVLTLASAQMTEESGRRLGNLLERQREGRLAEAERRELLALMQIYDQLWVRQSEALAEAVRRGLRDPLNP